MRAFVGHSSNRTAALVRLDDVVDHAIERAAAATRDPQFRIRRVVERGVIAALCRNWTLADDSIDQIASAFERADAGCYAGGVVRTEAWRVSAALVVKIDENPLQNVRNSAGWRQSVYGPRRGFGPSAEYVGGGFIVGPDGRRYPLVVPRVRGKDGKWYTADDGGTGDVGTLDGLDPGWVRTGEQRYIGPLTRTSTGEKLLAGVIGASGGGLFNGAAPPADYAGLSFGSGAPRWRYLGESTRSAGSSAPRHQLQRWDAQPTPSGNTPALRLETLPRAWAAGSAATLAVAAANNVKAAEQAHYGAAQVIYERNADGRTRARLSAYQIGFDPESKRRDGRLLVPQDVYVGPDGTVVTPLARYRVGPRPPHAEPAPRGDDPSYRVLDDDLVRHFVHKWFPRSG